MSGETWKNELKKHFEAFKLIENAKADTQESFAQFCEFIAEPAFESLKEEMRDYGVKVRFRVRPIGREGLGVHEGILPRGGPEDSQGGPYPGHP